MFVSIWLHHAHFAAAPRIDLATPAAVAPRVVANPFSALLVDLRSHARSTVALSQSAPLDLKLDTFAPASSTARFEQEDIQPEPAVTVSQLGDGAPLPPHRPAEFGSAANPSPLQAALRPSSRQSRTTVVQGAPADNRSFFERLFGAAPQSSGPALAYAVPETGAIGDARNPSSPRYDRWTAVYDISAHTVYLPNGTKLEAHSGLGDRLDNPRFVHERMRGPTPPHVYELAPREALFHGVQALRLKPIGGEGGIYGRAGLLAHTYMLGPNGDSNGCVSFRNYQAFLQAYQNGEIKRLAVVARLD